MVLSAVAAFIYGPGSRVSSAPFLEVVSDDPRADWTGGLPVWVLPLAILGFLLSQSYFGSTPGKRVMGISVIDYATGRPAGFITTVLRWLAHFLDSILMIGYLRPLWHSQRRTFADSLLSTVVVRGRARVPHPWVGRTHVPNSSAPAGSLRPAGTGTTAAAALLCIAAFVVHLGPTSSKSNHFVFGCEVTSPQQTHGFTDASIEPDYVAPAQEKFWGINFERHTAHHLDLVWHWSADEDFFVAAENREITATATLRSVDGTEQVFTEELVSLGDAAAGQWENPYEDSGEHRAFGEHWDDGERWQHAEAGPVVVLRIPGHFIDSMGQSWSIESQLLFGEQRIASATCR